MRILPVIMSGGAGTRLWPLSSPERPKQFHALATSHTMIQESALRLSGGDFLKPVVICGVAHEPLAKEQLEEIGLSPQVVILEPFGRNTAAVAAAAALVGQELDPGALILLVPADHVIAKPDAFKAAIARAVPYARENIITFGIKPTGPETGFGYIQRGDAIAPDVFAVKRFLEKPNLEAATAYVADGGYDWNAGIFLYAPDVMLEELARHEPNVLAASKKALENAAVKGVTRFLDPESFAECPSISLDYAVMERTTRAATAPCDIGWADVGGFAELWRLGSKDHAGNHISGSAVVIDSNNCLVRSDNVPLVVIGLDNIIAISTPSGIIVAPVSRAQDVKMASEAVKKLRE